MNTVRTMWHDSTIITDPYQNSSVISICTIELILMQSLLNVLPVKYGQLYVDW